MIIIVDIRLEVSTAGHTRVNYGITVRGSNPVQVRFCQYMVEERNPRSDGWKFVTFIPKGLEEKDDARLS